MEEILKELSKFSNQILDLGASITDDSILKFEKKNNLKLPKDFVFFISQYNGLNMIGTEVYPFDETIPNSIENVYYYEHNEVMIPQYHNLVPFSSDGGGNFYCLETNERTESCHVVFWVSNYRYSQTDRPEKVNSSFTEWVKQVVIEWTLEDYHYDGTKK